jgi:hypothetical protein
MPIKRVTAGQIWTPQSAKDRNAIADAAEWVGAHQRSESFDTPRGIIDTGRILIRNGTSSQWDRWKAAEITGSLIDPDSSLETWNSGMPVYEANEIQNKGKVVILIEPIATGTIGRAIVSGVTRCRVNLRSVLHRFARAEPGEDAMFSTNSNKAEAEILWLEDDETLGEQYALVRLGNPKRPIQIAGFGRQSGQLDVYDDSAIKVYQLRNPAEPNLPASGYLHFPSGFEPTFSGDTTSPIVSFIAMDNATRKAMARIEYSGMHLLHWSWAGGKLV